ncbi:GGDEF domain-containing protein (plasmid) [Mesorhizobium sp. AaZ16]|uniref:GGDEF domain-containing protein n=1 Tax=Mesorhizobium sp. AaZ16 TaxID=3402289 RepID=UPI00374ED35C
MPTTTMIYQFFGRLWNSPTGLAILGTVGCLLASLAINYLLFVMEDVDPFRQIVISAIVLPVVIGAPLFFSLGIKLRELARFRRQLNRSLSTDSLTECLDGVAFSTLVEAFRGSSGTRGERRNGALLVIETDYFKSINMRFGRKWGDEALRLVAEVIRSSIRTGDVVGRVGGKEFGVFLPGASRKNAQDVAERIRSAVSNAVFEPGGERCPLTITCGAAIFDEAIEFDHLFRAADIRLDDAKTAGRNRVEYAYLQNGSPEAGASHH